MNGSPLLRAFANARLAPEAPVTEEVDPIVEAVNLPNDTEATLPTGDEILAIGTASKRSLQMVSTKDQRVRVLKWMQQTVDDRGSGLNIISEAVKNFPDIFRSERYEANLMKCSRWWKSRHSLLEDFNHDHLSLSNTFVGLRKRVELKARPGRGRKIAEWSSWLYPLVRAEFEKLKRTGLKFSPTILLMVAKSVLLNSNHPTFGPSVVLEDNVQPLIDRITRRWVQQFQEVQGIVNRTQTGKLQVSPAKLEFIERSIAYHMGQLNRGFASGELNEDLMENMDETHFVVNMDNKKTLGFRGDKEVKYADVVSDGLGITMAVKITGGKSGKIMMPFMIFPNASNSYPIRGTPDNVPGVAYRTARKSFMTSQLLVEYYRERRVSWADPSGRCKIQWIDNYPGHNVIPECGDALARINTKIRYFPTNSTHLTQPCDSFVISKIKDAWTRRWEAKKLEMIQAGMWQGDGRHGTSGALKNLGWPYFLQLAADCVKEVNAQKDKRYGISFARMAMIRCGLSFDVDGTWNVGAQLTPQLKDIIKKYPRNYEGYRDGLSPLGDRSMVDPGSATASTSPPTTSNVLAATLNDPAATLATEAVTREEIEDLSEAEEMVAPQDHSALFQDAQPPESMDTSELWGFLDQYIAQQ